MNACHLLYLLSLRLLILIFGCCVMPTLASACVPHVEEHSGSNAGTASFRPHTDAFTACRTSEEDYRRVVTTWLRGRPTDAPPLTSLYLGRAVNFPWLSSQIADAAWHSPGWATLLRKARPGQRDRLAAEFLRSPVLLHRLAEPFKESAYEVAGISWEKVLFGPAGQHVSDAQRDPTTATILVPYDAQLWLRLTPRTNVPKDRNSP